MPAKYYILARSLWQGDNWQAIAGPYPNKDTAKRIAEKCYNNGFNQYGLQNLKHVVKTVVVNTTQMKQDYGINKKQALDSIVYARKY